MITPLESPETIEYEFSTADIETRKENGELLEVGLCFQTDDNLSVLFFSNWETFYKYVKENFKKNKALQNIWAHNGANFDWAHFVKWVRETHPGVDVKYIVNGSAGIFVQIWPLGKGKGSIKLLDSFRLMPQSLSKLAKDFKVTLKIDLSGKHVEEIYNENRSLFREYLTNDCVALYEILKKFHLLICDELCPIEKLPPTIGSLSLRIFRTGFLKTIIKVPWNRKLKNISRLAYHGGLVACPIACHIPVVYGYDVNSMYPAVMKDIEVPISYINRKVCYYTGKPGIYYGEFWQPEETGPAFCFDETGQTVYQGKGALTHFEIDHLFELGGFFTCEYGYRFLKMGNLFSEFIEKVWKLRLHAQEAGDQAINIIAKLVGNNLYGKFGQRPIGTTLKNLTGDEIFSLMGDKDQPSKIQFHPPSSMWIVKEEMPLEHEFVAIAAFITAAARVRLHSSIMKNLENFIYCDTDSMYLSAPIIGEKTGKELGEWKLEVIGEGIFLGKKQYAIIDELNNKKTKIRCKGIPTRGSENEIWNYFLEIIENRRVSFVWQFNEPATVKEVLLKGKAPAVWEERHRTIKPTAKKIIYDNNVETLSETRQLDYIEWIEKDNARLENDRWKPLFAAIREIGGIGPYKNGYRKDEYKSIPSFLRRKYGLKPDQVTEILARDYPYLGIHDENSLYDTLDEYSIWRMNKSRL